MRIKSDASRRAGSNVLQEPLPRVAPSRSRSPAAAQGCSQPGTGPTPAPSVHRACNQCARGTHKALPKRAEAALWDTSPGPLVLESTQGCPRFLHAQAFLPALRRPHAFRAQVRVRTRASVRAATQTSRAASPPNPGLGDSQNHRIPAWSGLAGPSGVTQSNSPAQAGSPRAGCTAPHPGGSGISPDKETPQPLWAAAAVPRRSPFTALVILCFSRTFPFLSLLPFFLPVKTPCHGCLPAPINLLHGLK